MMPSNALQRSRSSVTIFNPTTLLTFLSPIALMLGLTIWNPVTADPVPSSVTGDANPNGFATDKAQQLKPEQKGHFTLPHRPNLPTGTTDSSIAAPNATMLCPGLALGIITECQSAQMIEAAVNSTDPAIQAWDYLPGVSTFELLNYTFKPSERQQLSWNAGQSFAGGKLDTPVLVVHGAYKGPVLCLTAAVHGDELNGVEIVRRVISSIKPKKLAGTVVGVPIVNLLGLTRGSRYLPDRRDLNRYFPGSPDGSAASRIAYLFFDQVVKHCDYLVDFHTGSGKRTNLPQLRANLTEPKVREFAQRFGATAVLHHTGNLGMLRRAATDQNIAAVTFELGEPGTLQPSHVNYGVAAIETLLEKLHMVKKLRLWFEPQPIFYDALWVRANRGGILMTSTQLGAKVAKGALLGWVTNPITNKKTEIIAPARGRVLGMALNQFVLPGFATFHLGVEADKPNTTANRTQPISDDTEQEPAEQLDEAAATDEKLDPAEDFLEH